ncbi:beta-1,4-mannosyl-glycoprotein 4-beta-N-acetylglucosaminyltransferase [Nematostella vectensis]|uniref:beta-1,4-mannosyl-glycoprotein 4-beta-N-acetylglucosaminyltransferase n=1 Tax=Nematostella vectensis TaxID=45351 RepID=UPI0020773069|nr:beta-1,4-mannosyl-glycoprotein 4-beta-N-acetylglucosaminyltransferase [Nematostella vectensis]
MVNLRCKTRLLERFIITGSTVVVIVTVVLLVKAGSTWNPSLQAVQGNIHAKPRRLSNEVDNNKPSKRGEEVFHHLRPRSITLPDPVPMSHHVTSNHHYTCLDHGTRYKTFEQCLCREGWYGDSCDIPDSLYGSIDLMKIRRKTRLYLRANTARNVVYAAPFNHEFDMLEALMYELRDLVEVFILVESLYTAFGSRKPLRLLPRLHRGYLREFHSKILYLSIDHFPNRGRKNGWISDAYLRSYLGKHGVANIRNLRNDDVIIVCDLDEIPSRDSIAFLKFHDGFPEPFGFRLRWSAFGFFWKNSRYTQIPAGCTIGLLRTVYNYDTNLVRNIEDGLNESRSDFQVYKRAHLIHTWFIGVDNHYAGWHCSGCFDLQGIRIKFQSAQNGDFPRWGAMHEKMDYEYIKGLVRNGVWFDGSPISDLPIADPETDRFYAPRYLLQNFERYKDILVNPYRNKTTNLSPYGKIKHNQWL